AVVNIHLVRERGRRRRRELAVVLLVVASLGGGLLAYTWIHLEVLSTGYRIVELERRGRELAHEERRWRLEPAYLGSPQEVERRAVSELGLGEPTLEQVVFWEELP